MKKYLALMLCGLMGIGCTSNKMDVPPQAPPQIHSQQNMDWKEIKGDTWSIQVPKYFEQQDSSKLKSVVGMEFVMADSNYETLLIFQKSQISQDLLGFSADFVQTLRQQPDMKVLDVKGMLLSDKAAIAVISSYKDEMYAITYLLVSNQIGYGFSCAAPVEKMSKKVYLCDKIAATLTVK